MLILEFGAQVMLQRPVYSSGLHKCYGKNCWVRNETPVVQTIPTPMQMQRAIKSVIGHQPESTPQRRGNTISKLNVQRVSFNFWTYKEFILKFSYCVRK